MQRVMSEERWRKEERLIWIPREERSRHYGDVLAIKEHLIDELDYILVPTEGWNKLVSWYGLTDNQEPIARKVVEQGMFVKHCKVEGVPDGVEAV
ncbi:hypothetical protein F7725_021924 [Dissostichus mawsoni]|uniref:ubiquitinyl hydrolase 1 n=1 Tax=Dissostichus mawsoni TaxID=36200 RepID=A0A7J5ZCI5_DISMA|nr:hypothetical protein F7725_021924 [Dissostichus mawsoni]